MVRHSRLNREFLLEEYVEKKKSAGTIAQEVGVSKRTVQLALKQAGIPARSKGEANRVRPPQQHSEETKQKLREAALARREKHAG